MGFAAAMIAPVAAFWPEQSSAPVALVVKR
jgi:hypothetical protein